VDAFAVLFLMGLALLGLDDTYASRSYLVVGLIATFVPVFVAFSVRSRGHGAGMFLLIASVLYLPIGSVVAVRGLNDPGLPSPEVMSDVLTGTLTGANTLLTTIPPVDPSGAVLVLAWTIGYVFGGAAAWPASRRGWAPGPVLPLLAAMVVVILLGSQSPSTLMPRSAAFAGAALWWVGLRAEHTVGVKHAARGQLLRSLTAAGLIAGAVAVVGQTLGGTVASEEGTSSRTVLRGLVGRGADVSAADNPFSGLRRYLVENYTDSRYDVRLLRVEGLPPGEPLRFVTLDRYDAGVWVAGNDTVPDRSDDLFQRIASQVGTDQRGRESRVSVEVLAGYRSNWLPLAGALRMLRFDFLDGRAQVEDVRYNPATWTAFVVGGLGRRDDYIFRSVLDSRPATPSASPYQTTGPLQPDGAFLDRSLRAWRASGLPPLQQLFSLADYLRENGRYSNGSTPEEARFLPGHDEERLSDFFEAQMMVGDEEQYVAFFALAANRLGVPARVVVGGWPTRNGLVRGRDVAAWVEIRVAGGGWRRIPTRTFLGSEPFSPDAATPVAPEDFLDRNQDVPEERPDARDPEQPDEVQPSSEGRSEDRSWPWAVLGLAVTAAVPAAKVGRRVARRRRSAYGRVIGGWRELLDLARDLGRPVPYGLTRPSQAERLGLDSDVARRADALAYASDAPSDEESSALWDATTDAGAVLVGEATWLRRLWRWWNPASLLSHRQTSSRRRRVPAGPTG
jgi:hypothetical protein